MWRNKTFVIKMSMYCVTEHVQHANQLAPTTFHSTPVLVESLDTLSVFQLQLS